MRMRLRSCVLTLSLLLAAGPGLSIERQEKPQGKVSNIGEVFSIAADPAQRSRVWAVSKDGLFRSDDGGTSWQERQLDLSTQATPQRVWAFSDPGTTVFAGTAQHGIYRSLDDGNTWQPVNRGLPESIGASSVAPILALDYGRAPAGIVYCATDVGEVYRSDDLGQNWVRASSGLPVPLQYRTVSPLLAVDPGNGHWVYIVLKLPVHSHLSRTALFRSSDGGLTWQELKELDDAESYQSLKVDARRTVRITSDKASRIIMDSLPAAKPAPVLDFSVSMLPDRVAVSADQDSDGVAVLHDEGGLILRKFALNQQSLEFRPTAGGSFDVVTVAAAFQSQLGTKLVIGDEDSLSTSLPFSFSFFGQSYSTVFVNSNGNLTFVAGDTDSSESDVEFFSGRPRIAPLWDDLEPSSGSGGVYVNSLSDRFIVTWSQVPEYQKTNSNTFQAVLFSDGTIQFNYNGVVIEDGLAGVSNGGRTSGKYVALGGATPITGLNASPIYELFSTTPLNGRAISRRFYGGHLDDYEAVLVFGASELPGTLAGPSATAFEQPIRNDIKGIGIAVFNQTPDYGSAGRLQSYLNMNSLAIYPADPTERLPFNNDSSLTLLGQEWGHRFLAFARFLDSGAPSTALLGRSNAHWNYFFNSDASVVEGNQWRDNSDGSFTALDDTRRYSALDQYLMGLRASSAVAPMFLISNPQPLMTGTVTSVISTFGRTNNAIRDSNQSFGTTDRLYNFRLGIEGGSILSTATTAFINSSGRTQLGTDPNVVNTSSNLSSFGAASGSTYSIRKFADSSPQSHFFDPNTLKFTGANIVFRGTRRNITIDDIIANEGQRSPAAGQAPTAFRHAFILIVPNGKEALQADINKLAALRRAWETFYLQATDGLSSVSTQLTANPSPTLTAISPESVNAGSSATALTVTGSGFISGSVVRVDGVDISTVLASSTQLTATVPAALLTSTTRLNITVFNPAPGGGVSGAKTLTVLSTKLPAITSISPANGGAGATVSAILTGNDLLGASAITFGGTGVTGTITAVASATSMTVSILVSSGAAPGARGVTVTTPAGTSAIFNSFIVGTVPVISDAAAAPSGISQNVAPLLGRQFTLTVSGQNFVSSSQVIGGSTALSTTFVSASQLTAVVPASLLTVPADVSIKVSNPGPLESNASTLRVVQRGDINGNRSVNIGDALVTALTVGGVIKPSLPLAVGDANLSGATNIGDALFLALFAGRIVPNLAAPSISAISAGTVKRGDLLTITGTGFSSSLAESQVLFTTQNGVMRIPLLSAPGASAQTTSMTVPVPNEAVSGPIQVFRLDAAIGSLEFPILIEGTPAPLIVTSVSPFYQAVAGSSITLRGSGFSEFLSSNTVLFRASSGTAAGTVTSATTTSLTVTVPAQAQCGNVTVTVGALKSNARSIMISGTACPVLLADILGGGSPGDTLILEGTGFDPTTPSNNTVRFTAAGGAATATIIQAGLTQLQLRIPDGAVEGDVTVTVAGQTSNPLVYKPSP